MTDRDEDLREAVDDVFAVDVGDGIRAQLPVPMSTEEVGGMIGVDPEEATNCGGCGRSFVPAEEGAATELDPPHRLLCLRCAVDDPDTGVATAAGAHPFSGCPRCPPGNGPDDIYNLGPRHVGACHAHRVVWAIGSNLFSGWRDETEEKQRARWREVEDYERMGPGPGAIGH